ncbi:RluA family pseudouridine synthase [Ligaoa zhengdingensis]|uniref:RluA family pseudouridine synthase n=1 Tax=Ligaoa zhengdingensis TaxID=2763658 RepID=UPI0031BA1FAF
MSRELSFTVDSKQDGMKLYDFLRREQKFSYRLITSLKHQPNGIQINHVHARTIDRLKTGDLVSVALPQNDNEGATVSDLQVPIVYEDDDLIIYDKPAGMNCHPSRRIQNDTLANVFARHCRERGLAITFRCLNRLDMDTSGLVLLAKNQYVAARLKFAVQKEYVALLHGVPDPREGTVREPIVRINDIYTKRQVDPSGQPAVTHYRVLARSEDGAYSMARMVLETGRTHQIRVHLSYIGHPLMGDDMYGGRTDLLARQALHCERMSFVHPVTGEAVAVSAPLPKDMQKARNDAKICIEFPIE